MSDEASTYQPAGAQGEGSDLFSAPDTFYLTHQRIIEEWHALSRSASNACHTWMREQVSPAVAEIADELGLEHHYIREGKYRSSLLVIPGTPLSSGHPVIALGVGWKYDSIGQLAAGDSGAVYVGARVEPTSGAGAKAREAMLTANGRRIREEHSLKHDKYWPAWRYVGLPEQWWTDLDDVLESLCQEVRRQWGLLEAPVRAGYTAAQEAGSSPST